MGSVYKTIIERANEIKARKQADYEALMSRVYRQDEKRTSQISIKNHQSQVDDDTPEKVEDSLSTLSTERLGLLSAGNVREIEPDAPLMDRPNRYANLRRCSHKEHEGDKWIHRSKFTHDARMSDGLHSWCNACRAREKRIAYIPRWLRGGDPKRKKRVT